MSQATDCGALTLTTFRTLFGSKLLDLLCSFMMTPFLYSPLARRPP